MIMLWHFVRRGRARRKTRFHRNPVGKTEKDKQGHELVNPRQLKATPGWWNGNTVTKTLRVDPALPGPKEAFGNWKRLSSWCPGKKTRNFVDYSKFMIRTDVELRRSTRMDQWTCDLTKLIPKTIGNRKRDCAWGCASVKKLKKNQLLSTNHHQAKQIGVLMICAQQLIFLQFFNTRASSRTISFSISNSFWY